MGPSTTGPDSRCRDGSTESLADVEGGGETSKDVATKPVRRLTGDKPLPSCSCALEVCAVFFLSELFLQQCEQVFYCPL